LSCFFAHNSSNNSSNISSTSSSAGSDSGGGLFACDSNGTDFGRDPQTCQSRSCHNRSSREGSITQSIPICTVFKIFCCLVYSKAFGQPSRILGCLKNISWGQACPVDKSSNTFGVPIIAA